MYLFNYIIKYSRYSMFDSINLHKSVLSKKTETEEETEEKESAKEEDIEEKAPEPEPAPEGKKPSFALMKHVK